MEFKINLDIISDLIGSQNTLTDTTTLGQSETESGNEGVTSYFPELQN